jgi:hypothetical protein
MIIVERKLTEYKATSEYAGKVWGDENTDPCMNLVNHKIASLDISDEDKKELWQLIKEAEHYEKEQVLLKVAELSAHLAK